MARKIQSISRQEWLAVVQGRLTLNSLSKLQSQRSIPPPLPPPKLTNTEGKVVACTEHKYDWALQRKTLQQVVPSLYKYVYKYIHMYIHTHIATKTSFSSSFFLGVKMGG